MIYTIKRERSGILKIILCLDDQNGMMFNHRRQSQDRALRQYIKEMTIDDKVWMNNYSRGLYQDFPHAEVCEDFLCQAEHGDYCIVEDQKIAPLKNKIEKLIIFRWQKKYPADMKLDLNLESWNLIEQEEIEGSSHLILKQVYQ